MYCAIIGDIVGSKKIEDRGKVQNRLNKILNEVNEKYSEDIEAKFIITIGDEFQGLLNHPRNLLRIIDDIKLKFTPFKLRIGIGMGEMTTDIIKDHAIGSDGPAYYAARESIGDIKKKNNKYEQAYEDMKIMIYGQKNHPYYDLLNTTLSLTSYISKDWTEKQKEVIGYLHFTQLSQREIGSEINLEQSSVQRRLTSSGYFTYRSAIDNLQVLLNTIWETLNV